jgi:hypothetical protein
MQLLRTVTVCMQKLCSRAQALLQAPILNTARPKVLTFKALNIQHRVKTSDT